MQQTNKYILLSEIKPGNRVVLVGYVEHNMPVKLLEMGLLPDVEIVVKRWAPLRDPIHLEVAGYDLAIRKDEAAHVQVKICEPEEAIL